MSNLRKRSVHQKRVESFMVGVDAMRIAAGVAIDGQACPDKPTMISESGRRLRANLILEEALEIIRGLGFDVVERHSQAELIEWPLILKAHGEPPDMVETVDGCLDLRVVTTGTLSAIGVPDERGQELVDRNNLAKLGSGCALRDDGKLIKPPDHKPPAIREWLRELGWEETT